VSRPAYRGPPARKSAKDPGGRLLLGAFAVVLIVCGLTRASDFAGLPLIALGVLLLILFAFHSRISGALGFGKFQVPIVSEQGPADAEKPAPSSTPVAPANEHRPSLREVRQAARNPTSDRHRTR
jgi:hypothetical protein